MFKRKKAKSDKRKRSPRPNSEKKAKQTENQRQRLIKFLRALAIAFIIAAVAALIWIAQKQIFTAQHIKNNPLFLMNVPKWADAELKRFILQSAGDRALIPEDKLVQVIAENLSSIGWLDNVEVQITHEGILIDATWRKPLALIRKGLTEYYIDTDLIVLNFMPMQHLPIVSIKGALLLETPTVGQTLEKDDIAAAVAVLSRMDRMDQLLNLEKPLLTEIDSIDISNYKGRENRHAPHIVLYTQDKTEVIWGAEIGTFAQHLEADDRSKLAKLYSYYREKGSLMGGVKYINLRDPRDKVPLPIDNY